MVTTKEIRDLTVACLYSEEESTEGHILVEGINRSFGFHPERLRNRKDNVIKLLKQFSDDFMESGGGGMSFLNFCETKDGVQWGEHPAMEELMCLGIGLELVRYILPKRMWSVFPGGMPYFVILDSKF